MHLTNAASTAPNLFCSGRRNFLPFLSRERSPVWGGLGVPPLPLPSPRPTSSSFRGREHLFRLFQRKSARHTILFPCTLLSLLHTQLAHPSTLNHVMFQECALFNKVHPVTISSTLLGNKEKRCNRRKQTELCW